MYYDLDFDDWIFEIEQTKGKQIADQLMNIFKNYSAAKERVEANKERVAKIYEKACGIIQKNVS